MSIIQGNIKYFYKNKNDNIVYTKFKNILPEKYLVWNQSLDVGTKTIEHTLSTPNGKVLFTIKTTSPTKSNRFDTFVKVKDKAEELLKNLDKQTKAAVKNIEGMATARKKRKSPAPKTRK